MLLSQVDNLISKNYIFKQENLSVGIDLGTTNSLIASTINGDIQVLTDINGRYLLPSVVQYQKNGPLVGYEALSNAIHDPVNTIISVKRMIGLSLKDIKINYPHLPYNMQTNIRGFPVFITSAGLIDPVQVCADILRVLAKRATELLNNNIEGAVITVPAYFDDTQRQSIKDASILAKLKVIRILNEPTAAAIAYGLDSKKEGIIVVYDLGGGTFDISILRLSKGIFEVLATSGNSALGGDDFDNILVDYIYKLSGNRFERNDPYFQRKLTDTAINTKISLSTLRSVFIKIFDWKKKITREEFNNLILPLVQRTLLSCRLSLKDAGVKISEVLEVIMIGGSTRVPLVRDLVGKFFNRKPLTFIDPDKAVAIGAAIQANILIGNKTNSDILLLDVIPLSLGIETIGGLVEKIIPRNTTIPVTRTQKFTTFKNGQTTMFIHVVQGERELVKDCRSLAYFKLQGIPALPAGIPCINITFQIDADGLLSVKALETSSGIENLIKVKPSYNLTRNEINTMIQDSINYSDQDIKTRILTEQKIRANHLLESLQDALTKDAKLLNEIELQSINAAIEELHVKLLFNDINSIKDAIDNINKKTFNFATRRIDNSMKIMLKNKSINEV